MKYRVSVTRTTIYELEAEHGEEAIDAFTDADEVDGNTERMDAVPICPDCRDPLSDTTVRTVTCDGETLEEPTYCETCDREVAVEAPTP